MEMSKKMADKAVETKSPSLLVLACVAIMLTIAVWYLVVMTVSVLLAEAEQKQKEVSWVAELADGSIDYYTKFVGPLAFTPDGHLKTANGGEFSFKLFVEAGVLTHLPNLKTLEKAYILENASDFLPDGDQTKGWILASETGSTNLFSRYECHRYLKEVKDPTRSGCGFNAKKQHYAYWQRL